MPLWCCTAKLLPPNYLVRGKFCPLSAVNVSTSARQRGFPPVQIHFPRNIGDGGRVWDPGQHVCRACIRRITAKVCMPCSVSLPCVVSYYAVCCYFAVMLLWHSRQSIRCRVPSSGGSRHRPSRTANFDFPVVTCSYFYYDIFSL